MLMFTFTKFDLYSEVAKRKMFTFTHSHTGLRATMHLQFRLINVDQKNRDWKPVIIRGPAVRGTWYNKELLIASHVNVTSIVTDPTEIHLFISSTC